MNNEDNDDDSETANQGFNHDDYFQEDRGGARIAEGEDGYEEEMGGESQIFQVTTKLACQDLDIESSDDEIAQNEALMVVSKIPSLSTIKETASPRNNESEGIIDLAVPSPVCSSSVFPREDSNDAESKDGDECAQGLHNETDNVGAYVEYSNPLKTQDQETFLDASENKKSQLKGNTEISSAICRLMNVSNGAEEQSKSSLNPPLSADIESREMKECGKYSILCKTNDSPDSCELQGGNDSSAHQQNSKTDKQATKSTPVKKASIPIQNAPSKFSLMGVVFENSNKKKKKLPATKKAGLYIPSYAKGKNS